MRLLLLLPVLMVTFFIHNAVYAQKANNLVYVDKQGVLRWTKTNKEASFFGVNYTVPFAYSYRAHNALHADLEKAIREDVYHMARLGLDAFRVHVWDTEISDSLGNLLPNDHLRLFDFLLAELKKRNIKIIMTPIAFWGNGYPERDEQTPGFSRVFGKGRATSNDTAIKAQEHYLQQLFRHVNPYTHLTYVDDPQVIAVELNNEPSHSGPKSSVTNYINRLAAAIKSVGWTKPLYYNISQSPYYADAVAKANIDGVSFQWYPSGLVGGAALQGNYLPNVDKYVIPFDTIPEFRNKSRMVYEFDAADVFQSNMYPAIAKSFRQSGFQWATQFAYDPMALAYANTEYQTHYLNLAYTPSKAISLLIASAAFHTLPRLKNYGGYPSDSVFDAFRVSYKAGLSEMNTAGKFYYSNTTATTPVNSQALTNIAGVGSSPVVIYSGTGAYFLDKVEEGVWRLEVMPDVVYVRDPFERPAPDREVTRVQWTTEPMQVLLPDLGSGFSIKGLNEGNAYAATAGAAPFSIQPGTYLLVRDGKTPSAGKNSVGVLGLTEFAAPQPFSTEMFLRHEPFAEVSAGKSFTISASVAGIDTGRVFVQIARLGGVYPRMIPMVHQNAALYTAVVPADMVTPGELNYRIIMQKGNDYAVFPGDLKGNPFAWDNYHNDTWTTFVAAENGRLEIFNPTTDRNAWVYPPFRRNFQSAYVTGEMPGRLILKLATGARPATGAGGASPAAAGGGGQAAGGRPAGGAGGESVIGFQYAFTEKLRGRQPELESFDKLVIRARTSGDQPVKAKIILTDGDAFSYSAYITLGSEFQDVEVPLENMTPDSAWVMPRPYPGFQPLWFKAAGTPPPFRLASMEKIQVMIGGDGTAARPADGTAARPADGTATAAGGTPSHGATPGSPYSLEVATIWLQKSKQFLPFN